MLKFRYPQVKTAAARWVVGGFALLLSGAAIAHAFGQDPHSNCVAQQTALLLSTTHELVPDRAGFAADSWCLGSNDKPGRKRFD